MTPRQSDVLCGLFHWRNYAMSIGIGAFIFALGLIARGLGA